jgi:hypothetical protein
MREDGGWPLTIPCRRPEERAKGARLEGWKRAPSPLPSFEARATLSRSRLRACPRAGGG